MWFYKINDEEYGPVSLDELKQLLAEKKITGKTLLRSAKGTTWLPLAERAKKKAKPAQGVSAPPKQPSATKKTEPVQPEERPEIETEPTSPSSPASQPNAPKAAIPPVPSQAPTSKTGRPRNLPFQFTGSGSEYFKIWIVNIVLSILTLGIYSAWAKVRRKQYFYGNTLVDDNSFHYTASPTLILKGRLIVATLFIIYSLVNNFYPIAGIIVMLLMLPLLPWLVVRSLMFNARNSETRNIKFTFKGTYFEAAKVYIFLAILTPFTLGILFPYLYYRQRKFLVENSGYGTTPFSFYATSGEYYKIFLKLILPLILFSIIGAIINLAFPLGSALGTLVFYLYAFAYISVKGTNLFYNSSELSKHASFQSTMELKPYLAIMVTNTIATVLTLGLFHPFAKVRAYRYQIENLTLIANSDLDNFVADEQSQVNALGDEASDFFDFDIGL